MTESLKNMTENTQETPYPVKLQGIDLSNMETDGDTMKTLSTALGTLKRYVDLDLSNCYGDRFLAGASTPGIVSLKLPESVTVIEAKAFAKSKTLVSVSMPGVKIIEDGDGAVDGAFYGCSLLKSVELSRVVTVGANAFYGCTSLASLSLPAVANINYRAFYGCTSLSSISLPVVKEIGDYAFNECISLFTQSLPNAEHIGDYAFYKCTSISSITLPRVADIGSMAFKYCEKLQTVELPVVVSIGNQAFYNTSDRNRIILGNTPPTLLTKTVFPSSIEGIYVPPEAVIVYKTASVINWNQTLIQKVKSL
jgi:hypothetical protein